MWKKIEDLIDDATKQIIESIKENSRPCDTKSSDSGNSNGSGSDSKLSFNLDTGSGEFRFAANSGIIYPDATDCDFGFGSKDIYDSGRIDLFDPDCSPSYGFDGIEIG